MTVWPGLGLHTLTLVRKVKQRLYHLRQLRKFSLSRRILHTFYAGAVEHPDRKHHCRVRQQLFSGQEGSAERTIGTPLCTLQDLYSRRCRTRACRIMKDPHHPAGPILPEGVEPEPAGS